MTENSIPRRPAYYSPEVKNVAVGAILKDVIGWLEQSETVEDEDAVRRDLVDAFDDDGYDFARGLDRKGGWDPDAELVEILDSASLSFAHNKIVTAWVAEHDVKVPFQVGDRVLTVRYQAATVTDILPSTARIVIQNDREAEKWAQHPKSGYIINVEDATPISGTVGEMVAS